jgi:hypothetical protein
VIALLTLPVLLCVKFPFPGVALWLLVQALAALPPVAQYFHAVDRFLSADDDLDEDANAKPLVRGLCDLLTRE